MDELNGLMRLMMKSGLERMLNTEMDVHLGRKGTAEFAGPAAEEAKQSGNRRNGRSKKTVQGDQGEMTITTPRDRNGTFEPQIVGKHQRRIPDFDTKILTLYAKGMTTRDIQEIVKELYGVEVSPTLVSAITEDLDAEVTTWRSRSLDSVWPIVYFDGIVVHVRGENRRVSKHTMYVALGVNLEGKKELLGLWLSENEGAKFWLSCLTDLKNRGLNDIFVACIDGLSGFPEAIHAAYPKTQVQLCIVHLVRAALRYVSTEDSKPVARDLKKIYQSATVEEAESALEDFAQAWDAKYPTIAKVWRAKWTDIITLFDFPPPIRKAIYTTNAIESVNSVIRKFTKNRKIYPNEGSALKLIYMAIHEASKKWTMPIRNWKPALNHFAILYEDRIPELN
ncbi:MAG: IS256 family transposase [Planctomycetes bacterium]|nr:IS256 family transposase [Planctomycetota bacterium]